MTLSFYVAGIPKGAGSKHGFALKKNGEYTGKVAIVDTSGKAGKDWRMAVHAAAFEAMRSQQVPMFNEPVIMSVEFVMPRPKNHYVGNDPSRDLRDNAPTVHSSRPDATKLLRQLEDSLTKVVWFDDALVVQSHVYKTYGHWTGARVTIQSWSDEQVNRKPSEEFSLTPSVE